MNMNASFSVNIKEENCVNDDTYLECHLSEENENFVQNLVELMILSNSKRFD